MRLIYANPNSMPSTAPASLQVIQAVSALAGQMDVHLIAKREGRKDDRRSVASYYGLELPVGLHMHLLPALDLRIGRVRLSPPFAILALLKILRLHLAGGRSTVIVRDLRLGQFLLRCRRMIRLPVLLFETHEVFAVSLQDKMTGMNPGRIRKVEAREKYVYRHADGLICITGNLARMIDERYPVHGPVLIVPDGVDLSKFPNTRRDEHGRTLLYMGNLHHWKGIDILLEAMKEMPDVQLNIVGGTEERIRHYRELAVTLGVDKRVRFEGYVVPARRFEYYASADAFVLPLRPVSIASYFTSPLKLFEYMAAGRPIIAADLPAIREVLRDEENAIMVRPDDPQALAEGILRVLDDAALGRRLAEQAASDVRSYTWDERAAKIKAFVCTNWAPVCENVVDMEKAKG